MDCKQMGVSRAALPWAPLTYPSFRTVEKMIGLACLSCHQFNNYSGRGLQGQNGSPGSSDITSSCHTQPVALQALFLVSGGSSGRGNPGGMPGVGPSLLEPALLKGDGFFLRVPKMKKAVACSSPRSKSPTSVHYSQCNGKDGIRKKEADILQPFSCSSFFGSPFQAASTVSSHCSIDLPRSRRVTKLQVKRKEGNGKPSISNNVEKNGGKERITFSKKINGANCHFLPL